MKLFVGEFITGGGLLGQDLPPGLAREGDVILQALLRDLEHTAVTQVITTRDSRLAPLAVRARTVTVDNTFEQDWTSCLAESDAAIVIAPESDRTLYRLTRQVLDYCSLIGSSPDAVLLTTSKRKTLQYLSSHGIPVVPVLDPLSADAPCQGPYVVKPDDGVGGEGCRYIDDYEYLLEYLQVAGRQPLVQTYTSGTPASMSILCRNGLSRLLAVNEQLFRFDRGKATLDGIIVNGIRQSDILVKLTRSICASIPGLAGYIGVDLILTPAGPLVLEVNPRLTTAYAGLHQSLGRNPAEWFLSMHQLQQLPDIHALQYRPVTVRLE